MVDIHGSYEQRRVKEHFGHLVHLMEIDPRRDVIVALIPFWDPKNNVFRFFNFEMTPTMKKITSFIGKGSSVRGADLRNKKPIIPKNIDTKKYDQKDGFKNYQNQLSNQGGVEAWKKNGCADHMQSPTIIPMMLTDMFCALTKCINGEMYFGGCNILLQIWFLEHLYHHGLVPSEDILKIWFRSIISELSEMVVEQDKGKSGACVPIGDPAEKKKDQHIIRQLKKELEKAKATIARQEVQVQKGRNHQLELQDGEGKLKHTDGKLARLEEELESRIHFSRQIKKEHNFEISQLKRDLVASEEVWLNNCHKNMGRVRCQVHQLAEQTSYVIKNHRHMNDPEVAKQERAIVPHLPKVLLNLYETLRGQQKPQEYDKD
ncbi:hypothetical protein H5410_042366 [Solanum commersonii]|uniref:DUF7745 domain-containing protein n=1 Tax=Solanum commersonii TaxID=4109 RepID=A0A9J5XXE3_SOLCO|nr:hypothetical protein H5410_042366 [Solanum commersonii]